MQNRITLNKAALKSALVHVCKITNLRSTKAVLSMVKLTTIPSGIILEATDLEIYISQRLDGQVEGRIEVLVDAKQFAQAVKGGTLGKEVELTQEGRILKINGGVTLDALTPLDEYPMKPEIGATRIGQVEFAGEQLADLYRQTHFAVAKDMGCYTYNGILFKANGQAVGTDGRRLAIGFCGDSMSGQWEAVIPVKAFELVSKMMGKKEQVKVDRYKNLIRFIDEGEVELFARVMEGDFPKYLDVIPDSSKGSIVNIGREGFTAAIAQAVALNKDKEVKSVDVSLTCAGLDRHSIVIRSSVEGVGSIDVRVEAMVPEKIQDYTMTFNPDFIMDWLKSLKKGHGRISLAIQPEKKGKKKVTQAVVFEDPDDVRATYVLMPITSS